MQNNIKRIFLFIILFILMFPLYCNATENDFAPRGTLVINTVDIETSEKIENIYVSIYKVANYDASNGITVIEELEDTDISNSETVLSNVLEKQISKTELTSSNGQIVLDNLEDGRYLVYLPEQKVNGVTYTQQAFLVDVPMNDGNVYRYLVECTPKISRLIDTDIDNKSEIPYTSYNGGLVIILLAVGILFLLIGSVIYVYERKKNK